MVLCMRLLLKSLSVHLIHIIVKDKNVFAYLTFKELYAYQCQLGLKRRFFFLLTAANLSEENERLAHATRVAMTYKNMKLTVKDFW